MESARPTKSVEDLQREILREQLEQAKIERQAARDAADEERRRRDADRRQEQQAKDAAAQAPAKSDDAAAKRKKEREERDKAAIGDLQGIQAGITNLKGASLTLPEKTVFRESLVTRAALDGAATKAAAAIASAVKEPGPVLITARTDQVETVLAALAFQAMVAVCRAEAAKLTGRRGAAEAERPDEAETADEAASPGSVLGAIIGVGVAALNALSVEMSVDMGTPEASELETHVAVMARLLEQKDAADSPIGVVHDSLGIPPPENTLLEDFRGLQSDLIALEQRAKTLQAQIDALDAKKDKAQIAGLEEKKAELTALAAQIAAVIEAANTVDAATGSTPLRTALRAYALVNGGEGDPRYIAIVPVARLSSHQIALKRRLFAPRLVVSASAEIDVVVIDAKERRIIAAGTHADEAAFQVRFPMGWTSDDSALVPKYTRIVGTPEV